MITTIIPAIAGAIPGLLWYTELYFGKARIIIIGCAIGTLAILSNKGMLLPFIMSVFLIELVSIVLRLLYYQQVKKNIQGKGFKQLQLIRLQNEKLAVLITPPVHVIMDAKKVTRLWLVQFIISAIVLTLVKT